MTMLMCVRRVFAAALLLSAPLAAHAQIKPGEYIDTSGYGVLSVTGSGGALKFEIEVVGANFHTCNLSGVIRNIVTFKPTKGGIAVGSKHGRACSTYCGMRAAFEGEYVAPPAGCETRAVRNTRDRFKAAYDKKQYAEARTLLTPIANKCYAVLSRFAQGWVSNDLAITQYRVGDNAACRASLKPWLELAQTSDAEIKDGYPPSDAEEMLRLAKATRANLNICGAPVMPGAKSKP